MGDLVASDMLIFIERWVCSKGNRYRISFAVEAPPVFKLSHMATIMAIWDSLKTGGSWERQICKRNSKTFLKSFKFHRDSSLRLKLFAPYGTAERLGGRGSGISAKKIQKWCENCALIRSLKLKEIGFLIITLRYGHALSWDFGRLPISRNWTTFAMVIFKVY